MESESSLPALPIELWRIILLLACIPSRILPVGILKITVESLALSHVCRSWRYLVINSPEFWADISYMFDLSVNRRRRPRPELMQLCLERSLGMPLTLEINILDIGDPEGRLEEYEFLLALFSNRKRWSSARFCIASKEIDSNTWEEISALVDDAPLLEKLEVQVEGKALKFSATFKWSTLWNAAPNLTKLAVKFAGTNQELEVISDWTLTNGIPYHQLTHLLLSSGANGMMTWAEVDSIFVLAQNLVSCSLRGIHEDDSRSQPHPSKPPVVLQYLQHLDLSGPYSDPNSEHPDLNDTFLSFMNQTLTAASLQTLSLLEPADMWDKSAYADFITRCNPPLTGLYFGLFPDDGDDENPQSLLECLSLSPTLRSLNADRDVFSPEFSEEMSEWDEEAGGFKLCPVLEQMMLDRWYFSEEMMDMLQKRLCPPDGSSGAFKKIIVADYLRRRVEASVKSLMDDPYCLRIESVKRIHPEARPRVW